MPEGSKDMRVLVFDGPHQMHLEQRPLPDPGPGEARIRVAWVGICGSDLHGYTGESGRRVPGMIMGHEASGWVDALGPGVVGLSIGDRVTFNPALPCDGDCGHTVENRCDRLRVIGVTADIQGAFADAIVVPAHRVVPTDGMALDRAAAVEPLAVALQVAYLSEAEPGDRVLVVGGGMIGQCVAQALRVRGASEIVVVDPVPERRDLASRQGFTAVPPERIDAGFRVDRSVDAVGFSTTAAMAIGVVPRGGVVVFVGLGHPEISVPLFDIVVHERRIVGSFCYPDAVFREAASRVSDGSLDVAPLIGGMVPLEDAHAAFEDLATARRREVKILVSVGAGVEP